MKRDPRIAEIRGFHRTVTETAAVKAGARAVRLGPNRALTEAIGLCRSAGYAEIPAPNDEPCAHHWFEKELA